MKKVLILSVIAMLALSVMALAAGTVTQSATCAQSSLTVNSVIGIEQGYVATATSYDASFCGATGNPLTSAYIDSGYVLASLSVESNMQTIAVGVTYTLTGPTGNPAVSSGTLTGYLTGLSYSSNYSGSVLTLTGGSVSTPWSGTLNVIGPSHIQPWVAAGDYTLATTFTITPKNTF
jgi:hypothetical protein